jgi:hypothetical protein
MILFIYNWRKKWRFLTSELTSALPTLTYIPRNHCTLSLKNQNHNQNKGAMFKTNHPILNQKMAQKGRQLCFYVSVSVSLGSPVAIRV